MVLLRRTLGIDRRSVLKFHIFYFRLSWFNPEVKHLHHNHVQNKPKSPVSAEARSTVDSCKERTVVQYLFLELMYVITFIYGVIMRDTFSLLVSDMGRTAIIISIRSNFTGRNR